MDESSVLSHPLRFLGQLRLEIRLCLHLFFDCIHHGFVLVLERVLLMSRLLLQTLVTAAWIGVHRGLQQHFGLIFAARAREFLRRDSVVAGVAGIDIRRRKCSRSKIPDRRFVGLFAIHIHF